MFNYVIIDGLHFMIEMIDTIIKLFIISCLFVSLEQVEKNVLKDLPKTESSGGVLFPNMFQNEKQRKLSDTAQIVVPDGPRLYFQGVPTRFTMVHLLTFKYFTYL